MMKWRRITKYGACPHCKQLVHFNQFTISLICPNHLCGKKIMVEEILPYEQVDQDVNAPALVRVNEGKEQYRKLRDEMQIRSDYFKKGITRDSVGSMKFKSMIRKELKHAKAYRGKLSDY